MKPFDYPNAYLMAVVDELNDEIVAYTKDMDDINHSYNKQAISAIKDFRDILIKHVTLMDMYHQTFRNDKEPDRSSVKLAINMIQQDLDVKLKNNCACITISPIYKNNMRRLINKSFKILIKVHKELYPK